MAVFKFVISEPKSRKSFQAEIDQSKAIGLIGKKIGDEFTGDVVGLAGYGLQITGGTDKDGFPMHPAIKGSGRKKALMTEPPGYRPKSKGVRRRKTLRGNTISDAIVQINAKIVKMGEKPFEQLIPKKEKKEEKKEEQKEKPSEKVTEKPTEKSAEKPVKKPTEKSAEIPKEEKKEEKKEEQKA